LEGNHAKLQRLNTLTAAYVHANGLTPEENAFKKIMQHAAAAGLTQSKTSRLFGRNTYPTQAPEPHGYEYYLTSQKKDAKATEEVQIKEIPTGLYAVLENQKLASLYEGWKQLFTWVKANGYEAVEVNRGDYGWFNSAFEELANWQENKAPNEWIFNLWVQLKE
jgi:DNA gyrase inhibitor GyrI